MRPVLLAALLFAFSGCAKDEPAAPPSASCGYHDECPSGVCFEGRCHGTRLCLERSDCAALPVCEGQRCICPVEEQRCLPVCVTDNECPADGHCIDGVCQRYPVKFDGARPGGGTRGALRAGLGRVELDTPVGVSLAGFAMRRGPQSPYRNSLGGSNAWFDKPDVRALVLEDGAELLVLLRIPLCWSTDFLIADTARKVQERTGLNLVDNIITSAPHSHSQPARFWHLVVDKYFGIFGYDEFSFEIFDRLTDSFATAIELALADRQPARFGYTMLENVDPENRIYRDRRQQNDKLPGYIKKDDRMVVMRVDDAAGQPRAALVHLGLHGTVFEGPIMTADAGGGIEVELTRAASAKYGREVLGFFIQGNAGDVSPAGDDLRHNPFERLQLIGRRAWRVIEPALDGITTEPQVRVAVAHGRVPISHSILGYGDGEFHDRTVQCEDSPPYFRYGSFQCVEGARGNDDDPSTRFEDGDLNCVFAVECLTAGYGVPQFQKTRLSSAQIGKLVLTTMPGEPVSQFGRNVSTRVNDAVRGADHAVVVGYSQDHHFYLLNEDDWWQGGYEPSRDIWGWRLGPYLTDRAVEVAQLLDLEPSARSFDHGNLKPMYWDVAPEKRVRVEITETEGDPAEILREVPATVRRLDLVELSWRGGHPGADRPRVVLEREEAGAWTDVRHPGGALYDDSGFEMLVRYIGRCGRSLCSEHAWSVAWEELRSFPLGRYRLRVEGRARTAGREAPYMTRSRAFELVANDRLVASGLELAGDALRGRIVEPPAVAYVADGDAKRAEPNGHRLRSELARGQIGAPLEAEGLSVDATIRRPDGMQVRLTGPAAAEIVSEERAWVSGYTAAGEPIQSAAGRVPTTRFSIPAPAIAGGPPGDYRVELSVSDAFGNRGTITATITR